jgi:hypothetical protein
MRNGGLRFNELPQFIAPNMEKIGQVWNVSTVFRIGFAGDF